jgi:UrcA family protein
MSTPTPKVFLTAAALAAAIGTFLACSTAHAATRVDANEETSAVTVQFSDLDLNSPHGAKHLFLRLRNAAESVCGDEDDAVALYERGTILQCQQQAVEQAVERINRPLLTVIYDQRFPHEPATVSAALPGASRG